MRRELVDSKNELEAAELDYQHMGWDVVERSPGRTTVERGWRGAWGWHLLFLILVPIAGNLCYSAYRRYNRPEQIVIRVRGVTRMSSDVDDGPGSGRTATVETEETSTRDNDISSDKEDIIANRWD